jgi:hypothetical protein
MKWLHWLGLCLLLTLIVTLASSRPRAGAQEQNPTPSQFPGKLLVVYTDSEDRGAVLHKAQIEMIGGRQFLTGISVDVGEPDWMSGAKVWLPVDKLTYVVEFDSVEEYRKRIATRAEPDAEPAPTTRRSLRGGGL